MRVSPRAVLLVSGAVAGVALRVWILRSQLGLLDADEAVNGLIARQAMHGHFAVFFWVQAYAGALGDWLAAPVLAVFGPSALALKLCSVVLYAVAAVLVWRVGLRTVGERCAVTAAVLFWIWPAYLDWWSLKAYLAYSVVVVAGLLVLLFAMRLRERNSRVDAAALGLALGIGWWSDPIVATVAFPSLAWLIWRRPEVLRLAWIAVAGFLVGVAPWLAWNVVHGWLSLHLQPAAGQPHDSYLHRLGDLFRFVLPTWFGLRVPFTLHWILGPVAGIAVLAGLAAAAAVIAARRRDPALGPLPLIALAFPFVYAVSPYAYFVAEPRYVIAIGPVVALLVAWLFARTVAAALAVCCLALGLAVVAVPRMDGHFTPEDGSAMIPRSLAPLLSTLERRHANRVLASYWLAYRITFESAERVIATSTGFERNPAQDRLVRDSPHPAHVFVLGATTERAERAQLEREGYQRLVVGHFVAYVYS